MRSLLTTTRRLVGWSPRKRQLHYLVHLREYPLPGAPGKQFTARGGRKIR